MPFDQRTIWQGMCQLDSRSRRVRTSSDSVGDGPATFFTVGPTSPVAGTMLPWQLDLRKQESWEHGANVVGAANAAHRSLPIALLPLGVIRYCLDHHP